jgi:hypothetical protein
MARQHRLPRARSNDGLIVEELRDELLIYDLERHKAHCLGPIALRVWRRCDGQTTVDEMGALLGVDGLPGDPDIVELAIDELARARLVEPRAEATSPGLSRSRRQALKRIALFAGAAVAVPLVQSIASPTALAARSCDSRGHPCADGTTCCSHVCGNKGKCL